MSDSSILGLTPSQPPNQIYYNDRKGIFMVRATLAELDRIQRLIELASAAPPRITFEWHLIEVSQADLERTGLVWFLGTTMLDRDARPFPTPGPRQLTGILTVAQFQVIQRALDRDPAIKVTHAPPVTTLSGHRTRVVHELSDGLQVEIDCLPGVQEHGYGIELAASIRARAIIPDSAVPTEPSEEGARAIPGYFARAAVWDGQTLLLGGPFPALPPDPVRDGSVDSARVLLVMLTPRIVDPAGNPVSPPERPPFDPDTIPSQGSANRTRDSGL